MYFVMFIPKGKISFFLSSRENTCSIHKGTKKKKHMQAQPLLFCPFRFNNLHQYTVERNLMS